ncbi:Intradiol ring-cleavage dioxygenase [Poronia punctata]|nr:Intradiol ring-cleavage dioxygenase [Poronia punctata]
MVNIRNLTASSLAFLGAVVVAHPGDTQEEVRRELEAHKAARPFARRAINTCASAPNTAALKARSVARRAAAAQALREKRGIANKPLKSKRDDAGFEKWAAVNHDSSDLGYDLDTPLEELFDSNSTCALVPEVTIGPYWVGGELMRTDVTDGQDGVQVHLDLQFIDITSCEPIPEDTIIDLWASNATGIYSGVTATGQGGLNTNHGRGIQLTDPDGAVQFDTIFPGHYVGRTPHIHIMSTSGAKLFPNNTYVADSGSPSHIGQLFFDQDLIGEVEAREPYASNEQALTLNEQDWIGISEATEDYDPFVDYVRLGDSLDDGLLMYITVFVDTSADHSEDRHAAAQWYEGGGVAVGGGGFPGGSS